jgi:hypothetical protein
MEAFMATTARLHINTGYFFQQIACAERSTLVIDYDTTLRTLANPQRSAIPVPTVRELLDCIVMGRRTRVIVASTDDAREVLAALVPPYPEIWGRGGRERITAGAAEAADGLCLLAHPQRQTDMFSILLTNLSTTGPVAYLKGDTCTGVAANRFFVHPEFRLSEGEVSLGAAEEFVQFLVDWLRACAGEIC